MLSYFLFAGKHFWMSDNLDCARPVTVCFYISINMPIVYSGMHLYGCSSALLKHLVFLHSVKGLPLIPKMVFSRQALENTAHSRLDTSWGSQCLSRFLGDHPPMQADGNFTKPLPSFMLSYETINVLYYIPFRLAE